MPRKFIIKDASYSTKQRMKEVQFWFIIQHLTLRRHKNLEITEDMQYFLDNIIESFCQLNDIKTSTIEYAISKSRYNFYRPSHLEVALASKYLAVPVRIAIKVGGVSNKKMYEELETYIKYHGSYDLKPRFDIEVIMEIEKFNRAYNRMFGKAQYVSTLTKEVYDYDENTS